jgi:hypothetical protein
LQAVIAEIERKMKRINIDALHPGDIVLTASKSAAGKGIRATTLAVVSHAMICVQHGSVIDSTGDGVQAHNLQRELFKPFERVYAFRLREPLDPERLEQVINFARSEVGTRYSMREAFRSVLPGKRPRERRQFCSRLVARAYAHVGVQLVADEDYCTPDQLRRSPLLLELKGITETVSVQELAAWQARPNPIAMMHTAQNAILDGIRKLDPMVENFADVDQIVRSHPQWDLQIAALFSNSGFLELWKIDFQINPWHYNVEKLEAVVTAANHDKIRTYCRAMIAETISGAQRYRTMLEHYRQSHRLAPRQTTFQLVELYDQLVRNDALLRATAREWLERHHSEDIADHLEQRPPSDRSKPSAR